MAKTDGNVKLTPAMRQYKDLKKEAPEGAILLFRMGDFYELFFEDANRGAPLMDIVLTKRNEVPMCGVPYHSYQSYIAKLLENGYKVAIAEQMEDPEQAKGIVERAITQVVTPGTVLDEQVLPEAKSNFILALTLPSKNGYGAAFLDVSTGDFRITRLQNDNELETELYRLSPTECVVPAKLYEDWDKNGSPDGPRSILWTPLEDWYFDAELCQDTLRRHFQVSSLEGFGCQDDDLSICAAGALFSYVKDNLKQDADHITGLRVIQSGEYMVLDRISQRNLELVEPLFSEQKNATLRDVLNHTVTPMGSRMLREWILCPLREKEKIEQRLEAVDAFVNDPMLLSEFREALHAVKDLERTIGRLNIGNANARDLLVLREGLRAVPGIKQLLEGIDSYLIQEMNSELSELPDITEQIANAVVDDPPLTIKEGGIIREGYHNELDELFKAAREGKNWMASLQNREQERTGIKSLKVRFNKVFGYYIEITKSNLDAVPDEYTRKQTLTNAERFITPELKELENKVLGAEDKSKSLEYELFQDLRGEIAARTQEIQKTAHAIAVLDTIGSLADTALQHAYSRPEILDDTVTEIREGRHPVLERFLEDERFVPNDTSLDVSENQLNIITGPNMAGKSTYIRQVALIAIMAQMGSFVPARSAKMGIVDRVFTRVGAADDIARGQSTFMVEMIETANILNNATPRSLIILDEVGRGTSTFDGLSLAWAVAEYLSDHEACKARTLFATHYHELTELALTRDCVKNYNIAVREWGEKIIFLRKIMEGSADKSYGVHVARLAGLPKNVVDRAAEVLTNLEGNAVTDSGQPVLAAEKKKTRKQNRRKKTKEKEQPDDGQLSLFEWSEESYSSE